MTYSYKKGANRFDPILPFKLLLTSQSLAVYKICDGGSNIGDLLIFQFNVAG